MSDSIEAVGEVVQEKGQGGRSEAEVKAQEDEALQVAELLLGEGVAAQRHEVADRWRAHLHLQRGDTTVMIMNGMRALGLPPPITTRKTDLFAG